MILGVRSLLQAILLIGVVVFFMAPSKAFGKYWPRGTAYNDHFYPNIDEPDKFLFMVDTMFDLEQENYADGSRLTFEDYHFQGRFYFGGRKVRMGVFFANDRNDRDIQDLSLGFGIGFHRPFFVDLSLAYLMRNLPEENQDGWMANGQIGYEVRVVYQVKYRVRFRILGNVMYKRINTNSGIVNSLQVFPMVGIDFET